MNSPNPKLIVERILRWIDRRRREAALCGQRDGVKHFEACWLVLFTAFYGAEEYPITRRDVPRLVESSEPTEEPRWKREKYSAPVRKVVQVVHGKTTIDKQGRKLPSYTEILACGHNSGVRFRFVDGPPARHRRCAQCRDAAKPCASETARPRLVRA